MGVKPGISN